MRSLLLMLLSAFVLPAFATGTATPAAELDTSVTGQIVVGPDGRIVSHVVDGEPAPALKDLIDRNVATWRFEPILVDGVARKAQTRTRFAINAIPDATGNYTLSIKSVSFGEPKANPGNRPPRYPPRAVATRVGARVLVIAKLDARGRVADVHAYQTSLDRETGSEPLARQLREMFERASLAAIRKWSFTPGALVGGEEIEGSVLVPIDFQMAVPGQRRTASAWRAYIPGPISPAPWVTEESLAGIDPHALGNGESASLDSRFRLIGEPTDKSL